MIKLIVFVLLTVTSTVLFAQNVEITPLFGYAFSGKVDRGYGVYDVKDNAIYGGALDVWFADMTWAEIMYQRIDTRVVGQGLTSINDFDLGV